MCTHPCRWDTVLYKWQLLLLLLFGQQLHVHGVPAMRSHDYIACNMRGFQDPALDCTLDKRDIVWKPLHRFLTHIVVRGGIRGRWSYNEIVFFLVCCCFSYGTYTLFVLCISTCTLFVMCISTCTLLVLCMSIVSCHNLYVLVSWTWYLWYFSHLTLKMSEKCCKAQWVCVDQRIEQYKCYYYYYLVICSSFSICAVKMCRSDSRIL